MTEKIWMPEYKSIPCRGRYAGIYRLFETDSSWLYVREKDDIALYDTRSQALSAAKAVVRRIQNPEIRANQPKAKRVKPRKHLFDHVSSKLKEQAEGQQKALGGVIVRGKTAIVERRSDGRRGKIVMR